MRKRKRFSRDTATFVVKTEFMFREILISHFPYKATVIVANAASEWGDHFYDVTANSTRSLEFWGEFTRAQAREVPESERRNNHATSFSFRQGLAVKRGIAPARDRGKQPLRRAPLPSRPRGVNHSYHAETITNKCSGRGSRKGSE